jgi:hypothetical protein
VGFVIARVEKHVSDAEPVADAALGWPEVDARADTLQRDIPEPDDHGVSGLVEVVRDIDQGLEVLLDGDAADVDHDFMFGSQTERGSQIVAIDK